MAATRIPRHIVAEGLGPGPRVIAALGGGAFVVVVIAGVIGGAGPREPSPAAVGHDAPARSEPSIATPSS